MANAYVEHNGREISLDEYEATVTMDQSEYIDRAESLGPQLISEYDLTPQPSMQDLYMLTFVQNQRIYDLLALLISVSGHDEQLGDLLALHKQGKFLAPMPQISPE